MSEQGKVYDSQQCAEVPFVDAFGYMDERWLDHWSCEQTTLDWIAVAKQEFGHVKDLLEVAGWAQSVLTALNVGDVMSGSPLHLKLREVMIDYRDKRSQS
jgi:hypothetical protein